jgi:hypothetical protein
MKLNRSHLVLVSGAALAATTLASAGGGGGLTMDAITFPIEPESLGTAIAVAGGTMLVILFGVGIGFALVKALRGKLTKAVAN